MFALAVLLLIAAAAIVLWVLFGLNGENNNDVHFHGFGIDANLTPLTVFLLGALTLLLVWAATRLIASGTKRKYRQHKETKELKKEHQLSEKQRLEAERERERLAAERDKEHDLRETAEARQRVAQRDVERYPEDHRTTEHVSTERVGTERAAEGRRAGEGDVIGNRVDGVVDERATDGRHYRN